MNTLGVLKIRVRRGINLAVRDAFGSDPYVVITMGGQKVKTRVIKENINPVWNEELSLALYDPSLPITLTVYDKDTFTADDKMGDAKIDIKPYIDAINMGLEGLPDGVRVDRVQPNRDNCLSDESCIVWENGKMTQNMILRLQHVECGEIEIQIELINAQGRRGGLYI
uniref:Protein C2-DOMAIN ABA-RELATED 7-like n=2 Tax=Nicotiana TaxID=4085 RepID=A0A1S3ZYG3_TOBAC|nr:PREDICTED: probable ADP-ribosylation factor GTPase-activating protein AGD11 [Nicotiana sylvestris]XP_016469369.1 PREDICTED: protein C2-DOMAIN ABA-RELATED 7-like [Nicotiana tabacum]